MAGATPRDLSASNRGDSMHENSLLVFKKHVAPLFQDGMRVLEIGPDGFPSTYRREVTADVEWETLDIYDSPELTYSSSAEYEFPMEDSRYDLVLAGQVMEHVKKIWVWIKEVQRVCKPGGTVATITPVSWPYHEAPVDCWRIYPEGMRALLDDTSLEVLHCEYESLECQQYKRHMPGKSLPFVSGKQRLMYRIAGRLGMPVERAYDLVTVSRRAG